MPRGPRVNVGGFVYHVRNRANARLPLFEGDADYELLLAVLGEAHRRVDMRTIGYCIMPNHFHLVVWARADGDVSQFMRWLTVTHTQRWHAWRGTPGAGHVSGARRGSGGWRPNGAWNRPSVPAADRESTTRVPDPIMPAASHCGLTGDGLLGGDLDKGDHVGNRRAWLLDEDDAAVRLVRERTRTGRPCGPAEFVERLQKLLGRRLTPKKRGRKPKRKKPKAE